MHSSASDDRTTGQRQGVARVAGFAAGRAAVGRRWCATSPASFLASGRSADAPVRDPPRLSRPTLFRPVASVVSDVAPEMQAKTIRLLAWLLREHIDHLAAGSDGRRAMSDKIKPHHQARKGCCTCVNRRRIRCTTTSRAGGSQGEELMSDTKPYAIPKQLVWEAYQRVKANQGAAAVDGESLAMFEQHLKGKSPKGLESDVVRLVFSAARAARRDPGG